jgi:hypothetical protein
LPMRSLKRPGACAQQAAARAAGRGASDCASAYIEKGDFGDFILVAFTVKIGLSASITFAICPSVRGQD